MSFKLKEKVYETDENGYLQNPEDWNKEVARYIAKVVGLKLTSEHWEVINILREYTQEYGYPPQMKVIARAMEKRLGAEKGNYKYFYKLFPKWPYNQAYKIAGVPMPFTGCDCGGRLIKWHLWSKTYEGIPTCKPSDTPKNPPCLQ